LSGLPSQLQPLRYWRVQVGLRAMLGYRKLQTSSHIRALPAMVMNMVTNMAVMITKKAMNMSTAGTLKPIQFS
jgi:hypothetical protein